MFCSISLTCCKLASISAIHWNVKSYRQKSKLQADRSIAFPNTNIPNPCPTSQVPAGTVSNTLDLIYQVNGIHGGISFIGNSMGLVKGACVNADTPNLKDSIGAFTTIDSTKQVDSYPVIRAGSPNGRAETVLDFTQNRSPSILTGLQALQYPFRLVTNGHSRCSFLLRKNNHGKNFSSNIVNRAVSLKAPKPQNPPHAKSVEVKSVMQKLVSRCAHLPLEAGTTEMPLKG